MTIEQHFFGESKTNASIFNMPRLWLICRCFIDTSTHHLGRELCTNAPHDNGSVPWLPN